MAPNRGKSSASERALFNPRYLVTGKRPAQEVDLAILDEKSAAAAVRRAKATYKGVKAIKAKKQNPLYAYQVSVIVPGEGVRKLGGFPAPSREAALRLAKAELKRKGEWYHGSKLLTAAVPMTSTAAKHRNVAGFIDGAGRFHPIRSSGDYDTDRAGESGGKPRRTRSAKAKKRLAKARSTARFNAQKQSRSSVKAAASRSLARTTSTGKRLATKKRAAKRNPARRNSSAAEHNRRDFAGAFTGYKELYFPENTPKEGLSTLGPLVLIRTEAGDIKPAGGTAVLCQDERGRLFIGAKQDAPLIDGAAQSFGLVTRVEYVCSKPHLGYPGKITWYHDFETPLPTLKSDGKGGLHFHGGGYTIRREGIVG